MDIEPQIIQRGTDIFQAIRNQQPSLFDKSRWVGKIMQWSMQNEAFKTNLFRFVDVFPALNSSRALATLIQEYFQDPQIPALPRYASKIAALTGSLGGNLLSRFVAANIKSMAKQFIIGETEDQAFRSLQSLRKDNFAAVIDLLGEATISEPEAHHHSQQYLQLLDHLGNSQDSLPALDAPSSHLDWHCAPKTQISVKLSALYSQIKPEDFHNSVEILLQRIIPIYQKVVDIRGTLTIDMESTSLKNITLEVFKRLRSHPDFIHYPHLGIVLQAYLTDTLLDAQNLIAWTQEHNLPIQIRLVKGAYWDAETITAIQNHWAPPVWQSKEHSDANFEAIAHLLLKHHSLIYFCCASHNIRSIAHTLETAHALAVPQDRYEFQVLYGMAEPIRMALLKTTRRVRLYCPYGEMVPGMAYLVRRLLENTSNDSFLRQSFADNFDPADLLQKPTFDSLNI